MAKTSMVDRDIKRKKLAEKYAVKRAALKKIVSSQDATLEEKIEAATKLSKLPARFVAEPPPQPLRTVWPPAWRVQQVQPGSQQAARSHHAWRRSGPAQGQLVIPAGPAIRGPLGGS